MFKANRDIYCYENKTQAKKAIKSKSTCVIHADAEFGASKINDKEDSSEEYYKVTSELSNLECIGVSKGKVFIRTNGNVSVINDKATEESSKVKDSEGSSDSLYEMDDFFATQMITSNSQQNLEDGLRVKDLTGILGMPHQFLPITDPRLDGSKDYGAFGRVYAEKIIKPIPLLLLTPGTASFMTSYTKTQRNTVLSAMQGLTTGELDTLVNNNSGKYYSLKFAYKDYFYYVNAMLKSAAYFLDIQDVEYQGTLLKDFNWLTYNGDEDGDIFGNSGLKRYLGTYAGAIPMYVDAGNTVDDSFGNSTTESQLASSLNNLSEMGRELNFIVGNVGGMAGLKLDALTGSDVLNDNIMNATSQIDSLLGQGNVLSNILGKAETVLAGGRMVFPEIWSDSSFSRSYSCKMKLVSPSGDKLSIYLNILVPLFFLLGFVLPRQSQGQAYFSPFLCRGYCKSLFNIDMGIFTDLSVTKGDEGAWTIDGLPTVVDVSFTIKDLYSGLFMSKMELKNDYSIMSNTAELDYIANCCGININEPATIRTIKMYMSIIKDAPGQFASLGIFTGVTQFINNKLNNIFGKF